MPDVLALIPARGGSKSVPRKNLLKLCGKPLLAYSIEHAQKAKTVTRIVVSTEDAETKRVALDCGAEVLDRPAEYAQDTSPDIDVFTHALKMLYPNRRDYPSVIVHLLPTCPVRRDGDIDQCVTMLLKEPRADSLRSVSPAEQTPYKMWLRECEFIIPFTHAGGVNAKGVREGHSLPRQLLPQVWHQNGYIYLVRPETVMFQRSMVGHVTLPFYMNYKPLELDYPESIPALEAAIRAQSGGDAAVLDLMQRYAV